MNYVHVVLVKNLNVAVIIRYKMSEDLKKALSEQAVMLSDLLIKVTALERALMANNTVTKEDILRETKVVVEQLSKLIKENVTNTSNNLKS